MLFIALLLGLIEGMTEFLPVSSTGHLILFGDILGFQGPPGKTFEIVIQLGAILAICWLYRSKLTATTVGIVRRDAKEWRFAIGILLAFLPAMVFGALFQDFIKEKLFNPFSVSIALIIGGIIILIVERYQPKPLYHTFEEFSLVLCFKIGLCQCLALIPGTSRSGATIIGALLLGADRKTATEFSFFLAIPTMFAVTILSVYNNWEYLSFDNWQLIAVGFIAAFLSALLVVHWAVAYISKNGFTPFAIYRIILGAVMLYLLS